MEQQPASASPGSRPTPQDLRRAEAPDLGVLVMAYGGPDSLEDIPGYLADIRSGRTTSPQVLEEITRNYRVIGGSSPLLQRTRRQVDALAARFDPRRVRFYLGMRHWAPWIEEVVGRMVDDGIERAVSLVLAPHYSTLSVRKYQQKIRDGLEMARGAIEFAHLRSYHDAPRLIGALARRVEEGLSRWPEGERDRVHVVFSAHSLPVRILREGDPYDAQLRETARLVAERAGLDDDRWSWSYQSAGRSPEPWLGPQLEEHLPELARQGIRDVVSVPVGFVSDHVEILYDIDVQAQEVARAYGVRLERPPALNDDPEFIEQLAELVADEVERSFPDVGPVLVDEGERQ
jgi:protoporphyrin/coproporphyrin ferrochelatase